MKTAFAEHFLELKRRVFIALGAFITASIACYFLAPDILNILAKPLADQGATRLIYTDLTEAFVTYIKVACVAGFAVASPIIFGQLWLFIAPGLYAHERSSITPFFIASPVLFILGAALVYFFIMPAAWQFFMQFQSPVGHTGLPIQLEARISDYLNLVLSLLLAFGLCFQLPVGIVLMGRAGLVTRTGLRKIRRYIIVGAFAVAAVITPPDILSQILLAVPILILFEISLFFIPEHDTKPTVPSQAD